MRGVLLKGRDSGNIGCEPFLLPEGELCVVRCVFVMCCGVCSGPVDIRPVRCFYDRSLVVDLNRLHFAHNASTGQQDRDVIADRYLRGILDQFSIGQSFRE